jgi:hypothetical protein
MKPRQKPVVQNRRSRVDRRWVILFGMGVVTLAGIALVGPWRPTTRRSSASTAAPPTAAHALTPQAAPRPAPAIAPVTPKPRLVRLQGRVQSRGGGDVAGARVCQSDPSMESADECVISTASGRFAFVGAPAADATILASAPGYLPLRQLLSESGPSTSDGLVLTLDEGGVVLSGRVLDAAGGHVDGAWVSAHTLDDGPALTYVRSSDGQFELSVPPGTLILRARADAYSEAGVRVRAPLRGVTLVMAPAASIAGMVVSEESLDPIAGAWVTASDPADITAAPRGTKTDESGLFRITGLAGGQYELQAVAAKWRTRTTSVVEAGVGEAANDVVLTVSGGTTLDGIVSMSDEPCAHGSVELHGPVGATAPVREGAVHFDGLWPGRYVAIIACSVAPPSSDELVETVGMEDFFSIEHEPLSRRWNVSKSVREEMTGTIEVFVHSGERDPLLFTASIAVEDSSRLLHGRREGERFIFDGVTLGRHEALLDQFPERSVPVLLTSEVPHAQVSLSAPEPALISGRVVDERQNPIADAWVRAYHTNYRVRELAPAGVAALTNSEGLFTITDLLAGQYDLRVDSALGHVGLQAVQGGIADLRIQVGASHLLPDRSPSAVGSH